MRGLYVSYDGALDPLGATQVLPYLRGLSSLGVGLDLISFEKPTQWGQEDRRERVRHELQDAGIAWHPLTYHKTPRLPATLWDVIRGALAILRTVERERVEIVHCRGDVAMLMARAAELGGPRVRLLYDMRGFYSAERLDAGSWPAGGRIDRVVRRVERANRLRADAIVVLTERARATLEGQGPMPLTRVIPTCVDLARFQPRAEGQPPDFGLAYVGSLGTWYMAPEMVAFCRRAAAVVREPPLFLTPDLAEARRAGIDGTWAEVRFVPADQVPKWLARARALISFIRPTFSKSASFPTKIGEAWATGLPVVVNRGVGDLDALVESNSVGVVVEPLDSTGYDLAIPRLDALLRDPSAGARCRELARRRLNVVDAARTYHEIYRALLGHSRLEKVSGDR